LSDLLEVFFVRRFGLHLLLRWTSHLVEMPAHAAGEDRCSSRAMSDVCTTCTRRPWHRIVVLRAGPVFRALSDRRTVHTVRLAPRHRFALLMMLRAYGPCSLPCRRAMAMSTSGGNALNGPVKWRWSFYGLMAGAAMIVAALILDGSDYQLSWLRPLRGTGISATMLIAGAIGLVAGIPGDRVSS
jgi:hypothetical protein